jgi:hypothetical protein
MKWVIWTATLVLCLTYPPAAAGDTANPPRITSVKFEVARTYVVGELIPVDIRFRGGDPGVKSATIYQFVGDNSYNCLASDVWFAAGSREAIPVRNRPEPQLIRGYLKVTHNCLNGKNKVTAQIKIFDQTDLYDEQYTSFEFNVVGSTHIPIGTLLPPSKDSTFSLNFIKKEYYLKDNLEGLKLPAKTPEGILIGWGIASGPCSVVPEEPDFYPSKLQFNSIGVCELGASFQSFRSGINDLNTFVKFNVLPGSLVEAEAKAKAEAEAKAKAEAEAKAKELAEKPLCDARRGELLAVGQSLNSLKKSIPSRASEIDSTIARLESAVKSPCVAEVTLMDFKLELEGYKMTASAKKIIITCVKGKTVKKITAVNPKCPKGYKKK